MGERTKLEVSDTASRGWPISAIVALILSSLGIAAASRSATPEPSPPREVSRPAVPVPLVEPRAHGLEGPSQYCMNRFLSPFNVMEFDSARVTEQPAKDWTDQLGMAVTLVAQGLGAKPSMEVVIVTVPDPVDSGLGYAFETTLQSVRLGVETKLPSQASLYRDLSWLPWQDTAPAEADRGRSESCRDQLPGLVLFRGAAGDPRLMALLVVGETPTTGLHRLTMVRALAISDVIGRVSDPEARQPTRILGPTFSGTAASLRAALDRWSRERSQHRNVQIVTGSANGGSLRNTLRSEAGQDSWFRGAEVEFWSTTVRESELQCRYLHRVVPDIPRDGGGQPVAVASVALLHESGTEYGAALTGAQLGGFRQGDATTASAHDDPGGCRLRAGVDVSFPAQISALRDAYEVMDRGAATKDAFTRRTMLEVSLRERRPSLGIDADPSPKTTFARDIAVSKMLSAVADSSVRHVVIQATDIADAIFLARKIRDVAPDVRLAFLKSDVLLLHPAFQRMLSGSLVVTPYPFLGASDYVASDGERKHQGFESSSVEGIFNAMLALRGGKPEELREYQAPQGGGNLPIWITAIAAGRFVPLTVVPHHVPKVAQDERDDAVYPGVDRSAGTFAADAQRFTNFAPPQAGEAWFDAMRPLHSHPLELAPDVSLPRLWRFLLFVVALAFCIDRVLHRRVRLSLSDATFPPRILPGHDRGADRAIVRTKWQLYAAIRTLAIAAAYGYLALFWVYGLLLRAAALEPMEKLTIVLLCTGVVVVVLYCGKDVLAFGRDYVAFANSAHCRAFVIQVDDLRWVWQQLRALFTGKSDSAPEVAPPLHQPEVPPPPKSSTLAISDADEVDRWDRTTLPVGLARSESRVSPAKLSFGQLRLLTAVAAVVAGFFVYFQLAGLFDTMDVRDTYSPVLRTLVVHRTLELASGVSAGAPTLAFLGVIYVWAIGRMGRLRLAHSISQLSPDDGIPDLVSTPIRVVLYPHHAAGHAADDAFTRVERRAVNTILRPVTGPKYAAALLIVMTLPIAVFSLSPIATLESPLNTALLCLHYLGSVLIGNTLIQLIQYWIALERLLKSILHHRLGRAFKRVPAFVRDTVYEQVSRTPNDLFRLAACADEFATLVRWGKRLHDSIIPAAQLADFEARVTSLKSLRSTALAAANSRYVAPASRAEEELGEAVLSAAQEVMKLLWSAWTDDLRAPRAARPSKLEAVSQVTAVEEARPTATGEFATGSPPHARAALIDVSSPPATASVPDAENQRRAANGAGNTGAPAVAPTRSSTLDWRYSNQERRWIQDAEAFAATVVTLLVNRHVRQLQYFVYTLLACTLLLMMGATSYAFEPHRLLTTWVWALVLVAVAASLWTYIELDRNALLSHIAASDPGKLTWDRGLVIRVLSWGIAPLAAAVATEYPDLVNSVFRVISAGK